MWDCRTELVPPFVKLLKDSEAEVRVAGAAKVAAFCKLLDNDEVRRLPASHEDLHFRGRILPSLYQLLHPQVVLAVLPGVKELAADSSQYVRSALAVRSSTLMKGSTPCFCGTMLSMLSL